MVMQVRLMIFGESGVEAQGEEEKEEEEGRERKNRCIVRNEGIVRGNDRQRRGGERRGRKRKEEVHSDGMKGGLVEMIEREEEEEGGRK